MRRKFASILVMMAASLLLIQPAGAEGGLSREPLATSAVAQAEPITHRVEPGEYLDLIAQRYGVAWPQLYDANCGLMAPKGPHHVEAGWELRVPDPTETLGSCPLPAPPPAPAAAASSGSQPARAGKAVQAAASPARKAPTPAPSGSHAAGSSDSGLASIRQCESGGDYGAVSSSGKYRGAYQFDQQTWESVGGSGDPAAALPAEQDQRAAALKQQRGSSPWPNCG